MSRIALAPLLLLLLLALLWPERRCHCSLGRALPPGWASRAALWDSTSSRCRVWASCC